MSITDLFSFQNSFYRQSSKVILGITEYYNSLPFQIHFTDNRISFILKLFYRQSNLFHFKFIFQENTTQERDVWLQRLLDMIVTRCTFVWPLEICPLDLHNFTEWGRMENYTLNPWKEPALLPKNGWSIWKNITRICKRNMIKVSFLLNSKKKVTRTWWVF